MSDVAPHSSPVAGTMTRNNLREGMPDFLFSCDRNRIGLALIELGQALLNGVSAPQGEAGQKHVTTCHYSSGYSLQDLQNDFLRTKAKTGRSDRYLRALRVSLGSFTRDRKSLPISQIDIPTVEAWLEGLDVSDRTKKNYLSDVRIMFNYAVKRRLLEWNPAGAIEMHVEDCKPPCIHTPDQVRRVLEFARGYSLPICRALAVRYFGGLRSAECARLEEQEIKDGFIEVTAAKAKTRRRRLVAISPNLRAWLQLGGELPVRDGNNRWRWFSEELEKATGITWKHNVTRHSFASYHLAKSGSAAKTALEAGHTEQMLFANYREIVTPAAAAEFWAITPKEQ